MNREPYRVAGAPIPSATALFLGFALLLICFLFSGLVVNLLIGLAGYSTYGDMIATERGRLLYRLVQGLSNLLSWGLPAVLWAVYVGGFRKYLGLAGGGTWPTRLFAALITLSALPLAIGLIIPHDASFLPDAFKPIEQWAQEQEATVSKSIIALLGDTSFFTLSLNILVIAVIPAISEELFFRGFLLGALRRVMPLHAAVWLGAVFFSLVHFQFYGFFARIALGVILGYVYVWSGDLRTSMLAHFAHNFSNLILVVLALKGVIGPGILNDRLELGPVATVLSAVVAVSLLYVYFRHVYRPQSMNLHE